VEKYLGSARMSGCHVGRTGANT